MATDKLPVESISPTTCSQFWNQLQECLDAGFPPDDDQIIAGHVIHCRVCADRLNASKEMLALFDSKQHSPTVVKLAATRLDTSDRYRDSFRGRRAFFPALAAAACLLMLWMPAWWLRLSETPASVAILSGVEASSGIAPASGSTDANRDASRNSAVNRLPSDRSSGLPDAESFPSPNSASMASAWISMDARLPLSRVLEISDALDAQLKDAGEMASAVQHVAWSPEGRWSVIPLQNPAPTLRAGLSPFTSSVGAALTTLRDTVLPPRSNSNEASTSIPQVHSLAPARILG